jgi:hypothetical protein
MVKGGVAQFSSFFSTIILPVNLARELHTFAAADQIL